MTACPKRIGGWVAVVLAGLLLFSFHASARGETGTSSAGKSTTLKKKAVRPKSAKDSRKASPRSRKRGWRTSFRYRLARLRLESQRVEEIQRGLIQAGYLNQEPTGRWDDHTRDAMRRYQADHGFSATGLPEAKSLMKLGLGPHPLPEELDPTAQAQARTEATPTPSPPADPLEADTPRQQQ